MESEVSEVEREIAALYGSVPLPARGVLHVSAAARGRDGRLHPLKIGPAAPNSATDLFVLSLARACADAILTSGAILRAEPALTHVPAGAQAAALRVYRERVLGKRAPPASAVLTRSPELPLAHPLWADETSKIVLTTREAAPELSARLGARAEVVALAPLDAALACAFLQQRGHALVSVEAGPTAVAALYPDAGASAPAASAVDELWLSRYEEPIEADALTASLPEDGALFAGRRCVADQLRREVSGRWRFQRWVRALHDARS